MARKKRNRNKNRQNEPRYFTPDGTPLIPANDPNHHVVWANQDSYDDDESKPERGSEILDEPMINSGSIPGITKADFVDAGFSCPTCNWTSKKKGLSGTQAIRAHSKRHVNDRRSISNSHLLHIAVLSIGLLLGAIPKFAPASLLSDWQSFYQPYIPIPVGTFVGTMAAISLILALTILIISGEYVETGRRWWFHAYRLVERIWITYFIFVGALMWTDIGQAVETYWMIPALMPWSASVLVRVGVAKTRVNVSRREFKPRNQIKLLRAKEHLTDWQIRKYTGRLRKGIQDGRIKLPELTRPEFEYFRRLGLDRVRLNPKKQAERLSKESYQARVRERDNATKARKHPRRG